MEGVNCELTNEKKIQIKRANIDKDLPMLKKDLKEKKVLGIINESCSREQGVFLEEGILPKKTGLCLITRYAEEMH